MKKVLTLATVAMIFTTLAGASAFADWRNPEGTLRDSQYRRDDDRGRYRDNERVTVEGRISRVTRERGGYRVDLDRGDSSCWVPQSRLGGRDLRVGAFIRLGGVFRDGIVYVDDFASNRQIRGVIDRVNYRLGYLILREWDGDYVKVDMRPVSRGHREPDLDDLRRGYAVEISGDWTRDGLFRAERVDLVRRQW